VVEILGETQRFPAPDRLAGALEAALHEAGLAGRELTVVLLDDAAMAERNQADRGVVGPTDVLSYPTAEPDDVGVPAVEHLGDILIGLDVAARQAPEHGHGLVEEVLVLAAHGLTHLRGYDHPDDAGWREFLEAQRRILAWRPR
jgi:probable rRNA maturation factor